MANQKAQNATRAQRLRIKKGDTVQVIRGRKSANGGDRGKTGKVIEVYPDTQRVLVEGVNRVTKHTRIGQTARGAKTGGLVHQEAPVHVSNVMLVDPESNKPTRVGSRREKVEKTRADGSTYAAERSVRVAKRSGKDL